MEQKITRWAFTKDDKKFLFNHKLDRGETRYDASLE